MIYTYAHYFSVLNIFLFIVFAFIFNAFYKKKNVKIKKEYLKYFNRNLLLKYFLVLLFAFYYVFIVGGGDTVAYWEGAICMNNLFWKSPSMFFEELFNTPTLEMSWRHFDNDITGYPPGWIYREPESWFIAKICTLISFFTF